MRPLNKTAIIIFLIITLCFIVYSFVVHRLYVPHNVKNGFIQKAGARYSLPSEELSLLLKELNMSFMFRDTLSCGFDESYCIYFLDINNKPISMLYIALDGCANFRVDDTDYYLEGKEKVREIIDSFITI